MLDDAGVADAELSFRLGHANVHLRRWVEAEEFLRHATTQNPEVAAWHYRLGFVQEQLGLHAEAANSYASALEREPHRERWQHRLLAAQDSFALDDPDAALAASQRLSTKYHAKKLERLRADKGPLWQELDILTAGKTAHEDDAEWLAQLGAAQYRMKHFRDAAATYAAASAIRQGNAEWYFYAGHAHSLSGDPESAEEAYTQAVLHDTNLKSDVFGIGAFFQKKGAWVEALGHYQEQLRREPANAQVAYRVGLALDRCYRWDEAADAYEIAVILKPDVPYWHYKLGLARQRSFQWLEAAEAYGHAWRLDPSKNYWAYRAGYALETVGQHEQACDYYLASKSYPQPGSPDGRVTQAPEGQAAYLKAS